MKKTAFQKWLLTFIEEKKLDMSEPVVAGDGSTLFAGDVFSNIMSAPASEQEKIKNVLIMIDFRNGDVMHFVRHLANALTENDRVGGV
jgi:hypothetical protein